MPGQLTFFPPAAPARRRRPVYHPAPLAPAELVVLSLGAGQDSVALLCRLIFDADFRARYGGRRLVLVFSDTGDEHPETYAYLREVLQPLCAARDIELVWLTPELGFHSPRWPSLIGVFRRTHAIGSKRFPRTCTARLKLGPIYNWLEHYLGQHYGVTVAAKRGLYEFREAHGPVRMLLGLTRGEERRVADPDDPHTPRYLRANVQRAYPLLDLGMDRGACQAYIAACGLSVPWPSNCMRCCWADEVELLWLSRRYPAQYAEWVQLEAEKLAADPARPRRKTARLPVQAALDGQAVEAHPRWMGVFGERRLPEVLAAAEARYGDRTLAELDAYRMQHGHCIQTVY